MPTYEYRCSRCGTSLTVSAKITQDHARPICCQEETTRVYSDLLFSLKGSGFYSTDNTP